jgi:hypothetical protein
LSVKTTADYLRYRKFTKDEIYDNFLLLLYPVSKIRPKLEELLEWKSETDGSRKISDVEVKTISNSKLLSLCLYFMESEYHFTGDAIYEYNKNDSKQDPAEAIEIPRTNLNYRFGESDKVKKASVIV